MRIFLIAFTSISLGLSAPLTALEHGGHALTTNDKIVAHSGGCRKSSPAGQCCHAGSKPYHCH